MHALQADLSSMQSRLADAEAKAGGNDASRKQLAAELEDARKQAEQYEETAAARVHEVEAKESELQRLRADLDSTNSEETRSKQLAAELEDARKQAEQYEETAAARAHEVEAKESELQRLRADLDSTKSMLKEAEAKAGGCCVIA